MEQGTLNRVSEERITRTLRDNAGFLLTQNGVLHHLGFVVKSISAVADEFAASISARWDGEIIHDPIQRVRVAFFSPVDSAKSGVRTGGAGERRLAGQQISSRSEADCITSATKSTIWTRHSRRRGAPAGRSLLLPHRQLHSKADVSRGFFPKRAC